MSAHPNAILLLVLTPDDLARKTYRAICDEQGKFKIGDRAYRHRVMESDYEDGYQIDAHEGQIIVFDLVTYGYGDAITWDKLQQQKAQLEEWAKGICERHRCSYEIRVTANYW